MILVVKRPNIASYVRNLTLRGINSPLDVVDPCMDLRYHKRHKKGAYVEISKLTADKGRLLAW
jgi:hypothetical protein